MRSHEWLSVALTAQTQAAWISAFMPPCQEKTQSPLGAVAISWLSGWSWSSLGLGQCALDGSHPVHSLVAWDPASMLRTDMGSYF